MVASGGASAPGTLPTVAVAVGAAPPGVSSAGEVAQQRIIGGWLAKKKAASFGVSKGSSRRGFYRG
jgi:hypothetical protein